RTVPAGVLPPGVETLSRRVVRAMSVARMKTAGVLLAAGLGAAGVGSLTLWAHTEQSARARPKDPPTAVRTPAAAPPAAVGPRDRQRRAVEGRVPPQPLPIPPRVRAGAGGRPPGGAEDGRRHHRRPEGRCPRRRRAGRGPGRGHRRRPEDRGRPDAPAAVAGG